MRWTPTSTYKLDFNAELNLQKYTPNVGFNRVNQALIDHGEYLPGLPVGELLSPLIGTPAIPIGVGSTYSVASILTQVNLIAAVKPSERITLDATPGTVSKAVTLNAQQIQSLDLGSNLTLENNMFFYYKNSSQAQLYYFGDSSDGSYTVESCTSLKGKFALAGIDNDFVAGGTFRFAHVAYIGNFNAETTLVYDLTGNPATWVYDPRRQAAAGAVAYSAPLGLTLWRLYTLQTRAG